MEKSTKPIHSGASVAQEHKRLKEVIQKHDYLYHVLDRPEISDYEYDQLYSRLLELEQNNTGLDLSDSPSCRIGGPPLPNFIKAKHQIPMISLANSYSESDILEFDKKIKKMLFQDLPESSDVEYFCELKLDGLAVEIIYKDGLLTQAITRGDGVEGEDVTQNIKTISKIPLRLKGAQSIPLIEVRGEIFMFKKDFQELNQSNIEQGELEFANPRNAAAGSVRQLDPKITRSRPLSFYAYAVGQVDGVKFNTHNEMELFFESSGLPVALKWTKVCKTAAEVQDYYQEISLKRKTLPFDIDGIVVKVNSLKLQNDLGSIARSPRWATAVKYAPEQAISQVKNIQLQVGRTGAITPVAILDPVKVGGVKITNATLHNSSEIERKDIRINDFVVIQRAGDVIPEVVNVLLDKRDPASVAFVFPKFCPICNHGLIRNEGEVVFRCPNVSCSGRIIEGIKHFVGRRAMNIEHIGDKLVENLVKNNELKGFSDLYTLKKSTLAEMDRLGEKSAEKIIRSIEASKTCDLSRFIFSLGIRFVGEQTAKALADHFGNIKSLLSTTSEEIAKVPDIGEKTANEIFSWISDSKNQSAVHSMLLAGVNPKGKTLNLDGPLKGKAFLVSGTLPVKRDEAHSFIEKNGGRLLASVSTKLDYLICGNDPGSKLSRAEKLGIQVITWQDLLNLTAK